MESAAIFFFNIIKSCGAISIYFYRVSDKRGPFKFGRLQRKRIAKNRILSLIIRTNKRANFMQEKLRAEKILIETQAL